MSFIDLLTKAPFIQFDSCCRQYDKDENILTPEQAPLLILYRDEGFLRPMIVIFKKNRHFRTFYDKIRKNMEV